MKVILIFLLFVSVIAKADTEQQISFSQSDRDRLLFNIDKRLNDIDKRLNDIDKRLVRIEAILEQHEKRFEAIEKRFEELRSDMNQRFEQTHTYIGWLIVIFTAITAATIGFALWDKRTMIRPFETKVKEINIAIEELRSEKATSKILSVLRELAKSDNKVADALRTYNLLTS